MALPSEVLHGAAERPLQEGVVEAVVLLEELELAAAAAHVLERHAA